MLSNLEMLHDLSFFVSPPNSFALSHSHLFIGHEDGKLTITNLDKTPKTFKSIAVHEGPITSLNISSNNHFMITTSLDSTFKLWTLDNPNKPKEHLVKKLPKSLRNSSFSKDSQYLLVAGDDKSIKLYSLYGFRFKKSVSPHTNWVTSCQFSK